MIARKCDRCGKYYIPNFAGDGYKGAYIELKTDIPESMIRFDLCDNCLDAFKNYIEKEKIRFD